MLPEAAIVKGILANETMQGLIGQRVYPHPAEPDVPYPFVSYERITTIRRNVLRGPGQIRGIRLQLNVFTDISMANCLTVATALADALDGFKTVESGIEIAWTLIDEEADGGVIYDETLKLWQSTFDIRVNCRRLPEDAG